MNIKTFVKTLIVIGIIVIALVLTNINKEMKPAGYFPNGANGWGTLN